MAIKNIKGLLTQATSLPVAIEAKLPAGAPKVSTMLLDAVNQIPAVPDFPMEIPDLPAPPELPALPELPGAPAELRKYVSGVEVRQEIPQQAMALQQRAVMERMPNGSLWRAAPPLEQAYTQPIEGVVGQVITRRGM